MQSSKGPRPGRLGRRLLRTAGVLLAVYLGMLLWMAISPVPLTFLFRIPFEQEAKKVNDALTELVPQGVKSIKNLEYAEGNGDHRLDLYFPSEENEEKTLIIWIHGGGLISGSKDQVENYCKILAGKGFAVAAIDYTVAPKGKFPLPILQASRAFHYLQRVAKSYGINPNSIFLAGDSGGSMIAAQLAAVYTNPLYQRGIEGITKEALLSVNGSEALRGVILFCGIFSIEQINFESDYGKFMQTVLWAYLGEKDLNKYKAKSLISLPSHLRESFPSVFISAGNGDPLLSQSRELVDSLLKKGIMVDSLFFENDHQPVLPHEYQFSLPEKDAVLAFDRMVSFINKNKWPDK